MPPMNSAMPGLAAILLLASGLAATRAGERRCGRRRALCALRMWSLSRDRTGSSELAQCGCAGVSGDRQHAEHDRHGIDCMAAHLAPDDAEPAADPGRDSRRHRLYRKPAPAAEIACGRIPHAPRLNATSIPAPSSSKGFRGWRHQAHAHAAANGRRHP